MKRTVQILFLGVLSAAIAVCLARTLFFPKDINYYENRYAEKLKRISVGSILDGSFQDSADAAFGDQIPAAQLIKKAYNLGCSELMKELVLPIAEKHPDRYFRMDGCRIFGGTNIVYWARWPEGETREALDGRAQMYNTIIAEHPDMDFYIYYIEKDTDVDFETGSPTGLSDYLLSQITGAETAVFTVRDFETFRDNFYITDHHWNYKGSLRGAQEVASLLNVEVPQPTGEINLGNFSGSKATGNYSAFSEPFIAYTYDLPLMDTTIDGVSGTYGTRGYDGGPVNYGAYYGPDAGEVIFCGGDETGGRLLILGESYDNAILELLAPEFEELYCVDLRYYENTMGERFDFDEYISANEVTRVLFIGNIDYFVSDAFQLGRK